MKKVLLGAMFMAFAACGAWADDAQYPEQNITIIVPYPPGSSADIQARTIGEKISTDWGKQVIVDNRPGAGGSVGTEYVAHVKPDGYTLLLCTNSPLTTNPTLYKTLHYDPLKDFEPITIVARNGLVIVAAPSQNFKSFKDLVDAAKTNPGQVMIGTSGNGTTAHLALAQINKSAGVLLGHVPYNGGTPSLTAAVSGEVQATISDIGAALPLIKDGRLVALATSAPNRPQIAPTIPTLEESGFPGLVVEAWVGLLAPKGTPAAIIDKLNAEVNKIIATPEMREQNTKFGTEAVGGTVEMFKQTLARDIPVWKERVLASGVSLD